MCVLNIVLCNIYILLCNIYSIMIEGGLVTAHMVIIAALVKDKKLPEMSTA